MMTKELMTATEVAELLGYSRRYVYELVKLKRIPATKAPGLRGRLFFHRQQILDWVAEGCPVSNSTSH